VKSLILFFKSEKEFDRLTLGKSENDKHWVAASHPPSKGMCLHSCEVLRTTKNMFASIKKLHNLVKSLILLLKIRKRVRQTHFRQKLG
jgi:hypothetical protein